jgi:DNA-binding winged helix-turn-helix (wHTH) protein
MDDRMRASRVVRFGLFEFEPAARELRKNGRRVHLQDKPFDMLGLLLQHRGEIVTRDELRHGLWPADTFIVFDDSVNTAVRKLREALGDSADNPRFVETVPRHGYRFIAPIQSDEARPTTFGLGLLGGVAALAAVTTAIWLFSRPSDSP